MIEKGDMLGAQRAMISAGIAADKTGQLEEAAGRADDRQVRISGEQGRLIAAVLRMFLEAIGVPESPATRTIMRTLLMQASAGDVLAVGPADSQVAYAEVRSTFEGRLRQEILQELQAEHLALPAPSEELEEEPVPEPEELLDVPKPEPIGDAEVVPDPAPDPLHPVIGSMRRRPWTGRSSNGGAIGPRDPHSIFGPGPNMRSPGGSL